MHWVGGGGSSCDETRDLFTLQTIQNPLLLLSHIGLAVQHLCYGYRERVDKEDSTDYCSSHQANLKKWDSLNQAHGYPNTKTSLTKAMSCLYCIVGICMGCK